jgi:hypothetical protein
MLAIATLSLIALAPFARGELQHTGVLRGAVVPALATLIAFVLPLDMTMSRVFMSDSQGIEAARYGRIIRFEAWLLALLLAVWVPTLAVKLVSG